MAPARSGISGEARPSKTSSCPSSKASFWASRSMANHASISRPARTRLIENALGSRLRRLGARPWRAFGGGLHRREAALEIATDHLVHIHEKRHRFSDEIVLPIHRPRHLRDFGARSERESGRVGGGERLHELELDREQRSLVALLDPHSALAYLVVARPHGTGATNRRRPVER